MALPAERSGPAAGREELNGIGWGLAAVLVLWAGITLLRRRREEIRGAVPSPRARSAADDDIDHAALEEAEREVRDLDTDTKGRPLDDVVGDDWGPGTPKPPYM